MANGQDEEKWAEGLWKWRRDYLWRDAHTLEGLGQQFWSIVGLDPDMDPELLTEDDVERLDDELANVYAARNLEGRFGGWTIPELRSQWVSQYAVPGAGKEIYGEYPVTYNPKETAAGRYYLPPLGKRIELGETGHMASVLAHELAHVHYFEYLSPEARKAVTPILDWLERTSPEFRKAMHSVVGDPEELRKWREQPEERHAVLYQIFGKHPEKIPYYLDKYYLNLKPWQPEGALGARRWALREGHITPGQFYKHPWEEEW